MPCESEQVYRAGDALPWVVACKRRSPKVPEGVRKHFAPFLPFNYGCSGSRSAVGKRKCAEVCYLPGIFGGSLLSEWALAWAPRPRSILCPSFCHWRWSRYGHLTLPVFITLSLGQKNRNGSRGRGGRFHLASVPGSRKEWQQRAPSSGARDGPVSLIQKPPSV